MSDPDYIIRTPLPKKQGGGYRKLGTPVEVLKQLAQFNIGPDTPGGKVLYGPGIELIPSDEDGFVQWIDVWVHEPELFDTLKLGRFLKFLRREGWALIDPETGWAFPQPRDEDDDEPVDSAL